MDSLYFQRTKIPTALGVFALVVIMAALIFGTSNLGQVKNIFTRAEQNAAPSSQVEMANVSASSFSVLWTTRDQTPGAVFYGKTPSVEDGVAVDDRDLASPNGKYTTHLVRVSGLEAETKYYFKIGATGPNFGDPANSQQPFEIVTGKQIANSSSVEPIFGKVTHAAGTPGSGAIVVWQTLGAAKLATLVKSDGSYVLPLATARTTDLNSTFSIKIGQPETIEINAAAEGTSTIKCVYGSDKPLPTVKVGETIDCSDKGSSAKSEPSPAAKNERTATPAARFKVPIPKFGATSTASTSPSNSQLNIVSGQSVSTPFPTISGKAKPRQMVKIVVNSETPYSGTVIAGPDGRWTWTPPAGLSPGEHTVTITIVNPDGTTQTIARNFTVDSSNPLLPITSGTPSAEVTHLACVNNACAAVSGAGVDSCSTSADCEASTSPPPVSGAAENTMLMLILGVVFIALSAGLVLKRN